VPQTARRDDPRWEAAADEHRIALATFLEAAERVSADAWARPLGPGKWSPAQTAEHLALAYEALIGELSGGAGMVPRLPPLRQKVLRWVLLPHILFHRSFPLRARAPREARPGEAHPDRDGVLARLRDTAERFEEALHRARDAGGGQVTHPYFGAIPPVKALRFCAVHLEHHARQVGR
jgi:hypothetical protein